MPNVARTSGVSKSIPRRRGTRHTVGTRGGSRALRLRGFFAVTDFSIFHMVGLCECSLASEGANYLDGSTRNGTAAAVYGSI
jgi:hypothetical protein